MFHCQVDTVTARTTHIFPLQVVSAIRLVAARFIGRLICPTTVSTSPLPLRCGGKPSVARQSDVTSNCTRCLVLGTSMNISAHACAHCYSGCALRTDVARFTMCSYPLHGRHMTCSGISIAHAITVACWLSRAFATYGLETPLCVLLLEHWSCCIAR